MATTGDNAAHRLGRQAEQMAADHLTDKGYRIVRRNYRGARGEVDLIAQDDDVWVFVEVKARRSAAFGGAHWAISPAKRAQVAKVARHFLVAEGLYGRVPCRFDVVLVDAGTTPFGMTHLANAFAMEV